jgi:acetolactate synthase-1/2/3 large subunit
VSEGSGATTVSTGGEAIVDGLAAHGVHTVFGLPGAQTYGLFDALGRSEIRVIGARHEQACGYMAFGQARSTGKPGVFSVVPGPGLMNASAALLTAFGGNEPVLCVTGQVPTAYIGKGRGHLHEMPDQLATLRGIVKWAERIEYPGSAPALVARAFQEMRSGRRGPAALEMPWDVFTQRAEVVQPGPLAPLPAPPPDGDRVEAAAALVAAARAPMIFVGSGAFGAEAEILELAELIDAPVVAFRSGRGVVSNAHELGLTPAAAHHLWAGTDLMIGIGSRMELPTLFRWPVQPDGLRSIRIDIDPVEQRRLTVDAPIVADAQAGTRALLAAARAAGSTRTGGRRALIRAASARAQHEIQAIQPQLAYLEILRDVLPANAIVTDELSQVGFTSWFGFPVYEPRTFISSGYQGTLGSGFPTALGGIAPSSRSRATAASCSRCRSSRPRCSSGSASWCSCSTTARTATCAATSCRRSRAASSPPISSTPTSCGWPTPSAWLPRAWDRPTRSARRSSGRLPTAGRT